MEVNEEKIVDVSVIENGRKTRKDKILENLINRKFDERKIINIIERY